MRSLCLNFKEKYKKTSTIFSFRAVLLFIGKNIVSTCLPGVEVDKRIKKAWVSVPRVREGAVVFQFGQSPAKLQGVGPWRWAKPLTAADWPWIGLDWIGCLYHSMSEKMDAIRSNTSLNCPNPTRISFSGFD